MKLQEIFDQLTSGEFTQISIGGEDQGKITENNCKVVIDHINLGLVELFQRFYLKEGTLKLLLYPSISEYVVDKKYCMSDTTPGPQIKYFEDSLNPYMGNFLKFHSFHSITGAVFDESILDYCTGITITSSNSFTVAPEILERSPTLPDRFKTSHLVLKYRASLPKLDRELGFPDLVSLDVGLPYQYLSALLYFVASRTYGPVGQNAEGSLGAMYNAKFENACKSLQTHKSDMDYSTGATKLKKRGWV